jgi:hypothetical protein
MATVTLSSHNFARILIAQQEDGMGMPGADAPAHKGNAEPSTSDELLQTVAMLDKEIQDAKVQ